METCTMFAMKKLDLKIPVLQIVLIYVCLALLLAACDVKTSCSMQAVAGGSQYCEETITGE